MTAAGVSDARVNRHAWLQKHPSPLATGGEFHWYPDAGDRELRASFVERVRGLEPPAVLWQLERGRVAWGQVFSAIAPLDGRRYVGLVLSVVEGDRTAADLLARLAPPPPAAWADGVAGESFAPRPTAQELAALRRGPRGDATAVARALLSGGTADVDDPTADELPQWIASIERVLPEPGPAPRCGAWRAGAGGASGSRDRVAELAAAAWREPASRAGRAWTLLCELAIARGESVDRVGVALELIDPAGQAARRTGTAASGPALRDPASAGVAAAALTAGERAELTGCNGVAAAALTAGERAELTGCDGVLDVLHAWGRGRLDRSPTADTLPARLADLVALRVLARLAADDDPGTAIAEARWYALLSAGRRQALLAAVAARTASLRALVEAYHA